MHLGELLLYLNLHHLIIYQPEVYATHMTNMESPLSDFKTYLWLPHLSVFYISTLDAYC